jgi:hypothetical protein
MSRTFLPQDVQFSGKREEGMEGESGEPLGLRPGGDNNNGRRGRNGRLRLTKPGGEKQHAVRQGEILTVWRLFAM